MIVLYHLEKDESFGDHEHQGIRGHKTSRAWLLHEGDESQINKFALSYLGSKEVNSSEHEFGDKSVHSQHIVVIRHVPVSFPLPPQGFPFAHAFDAGPTYPSEH